MSTGTEPSGSAPSVPERRAHPAFSSPHLRQTLITFVIAVAVGVAFYFWSSRRQSELVDQQQRQFEAAVSQVQSSDALTKEEVAALRSSGAKGVDDLRAEIARMRAAGDASQRELEVLRRQASERRSSIAVAQAKTTQVRAQVRRTTEQLTRLQAELATWKTSYESLLTNESGRRIAASEAHLKLAAGVLQRQRPALDELTTWEKSLSILAKPLDEETGEKDTDLLLSAQHVSEIEAIDSRVRDCLEQLQSDRALIDAVMKEATTLEPAAMTIEQVLNAQALAEGKLIQERLQSARKSQLEEQTVALERAQAELIKSETAVKQQEIANQRARLGSQLSSLADEQEEIKQRERQSIEQQQLEREFQAALPEIRRYLIAFISDGLQNRGRNQGNGPMSFSVIEGAGALARNENGRQNLAHLVGNNDRGLGPLPRFRGGMTKQHQDACDRAQQLLIKFGPVMVEKGMLAK